MADENRFQQMVLELEASSTECRRALHVLNQAQGIGFVTAAIGIFLVLAGMYVWEFWRPYTPLAATMCLFSGCGLIAFPVGVISGWLAHRIFYKTQIPVVRMTVIFALIGDFTIFGWVLVALCSS